MAALVDSFPYPWDRPEARELHVLLSQLYPSGRAAIFIAQKVGLDAGMINVDQAPYMVWKDILDLSGTSMKTRTLVTHARTQYAENPRRPFLDALLKDETPVGDSEPRGEFGAPKFLTADDCISEPEALLFRDDLTLPIGRVPWLIRVLEKLLAVAPAVCRLTVRNDAQAKAGTGFCIASDLLLTNWHVLTFNDVAATAVTAEFRYEDDGKGGGLASTAIECDVATIRGEKAADWAIVRVASPLPEPFVTLRLSEASEPVLNGSVFIIQHPAGDRKRVAYVRNQVTAFTDRVVHYLSDTQSGSSGSPVLDDTGRLIALHHAGGRPQELAGKAPLVKNEGIRISTVLAGLMRLGVPIV